MKILIINTDYADFLKNLYLKIPDLDKKSYEDQMSVRNESVFGSSDFYSYNLEKNGYQAIDVHYNNVTMQTRWAEENLKPNKVQWKMKKLLHQLGSNKIGKWLGYKIFNKNVFQNLEFLGHILKAQISVFKPDIILNQALVEVPVNLLRKIKNPNSQLIGQIASPLPSDEVLKSYDMLISSLPNQVAKFASLGISAAYLKLAFDERLLSRLPEVERDIPIVFVGSVTSSHQARVQFLEYLCERTDIKIWGSLHELPHSSSIYKRYQGEAWGIDMYNIFRRSKVVLNNHIDLAENYANNMRLYEATGCGALLLTDLKSNLEEIFKINTEVLAYSTFEECLEKIEFCLSNDEARRNIAKAGQDRTLKDHSYFKRMKDMSTLMLPLLKRPSKEM